MTFQKRSTSQKILHIFTLGTNHITHSSHYYNLVLKINSTGNFNSAVNILRANSRRGMYAIKRKCPLETPVRIWPEILESAVLPVALYASGAWSSVTEKSEKLDKCLIVRQIL